MNNKIFAEEVQKFLASGECIAFVGAGMGLYTISKDGSPDYMPLGKELSQNLAEKILKIEYKDQPLSELAEYYELLLAHNRIPLMDWLKNQLKNDHRMPGPIHKILVSLPFKCFVTTNYDTILTRILRDSKQIDPYVWLIKGGHASPPDPQKGTIYMIHGSIENYDSIIITDSDIDSYFREAKSGVSSTDKVIRQLSSLLEENSLLFLGYSLRDRHFRDIWAALRFLTQKTRLTKPAFCLMPDADEHSIRYWYDRGVNVLPLKPDALLAYLAHNLGRELFINYFIWKVCEQFTLSVQEAQSQISNMMSENNYPDFPSAAAAYCVEKGVSTREYDNLL